jgi:predicted CXXCH cytochrome family protein
MESPEMKTLKINRSVWLTFTIIFSLCLLTGAFIGSKGIAIAAPGVEPANQTYAGSESCAQCHEELHDDWINTRHAQAFSAPIFQRDWTELGQQTSCLECHTTGYNKETGAYAEEGITCEACHGPFQPNHPQQLMPITPDADLCSTCHKTTTDEWRASPHIGAGIQCQACHNPHAQTPKADTITGLCTNCHKEMGESFTHGTHADSGVECSNCHMYTSPQFEDPILGLVPTGHTFTVGSDTCIGCHQDTVHTRDEIIKLSGEIEEMEVVDTATMEQTITDQAQEIEVLETKSTARLYIGLAQGAIIGLVTGGTAAWVISRRIEVVEVKEDEQKEDEG